MSGRVCLFCGKALSRIRVGGGEDFCSREHRNHYRLRRGMDQLQEANQMATLMRRRENPKPLTTMIPAGDGANGPRGFLLPAASRPRVRAAGWRPASLGLAARPKMVVPAEGTPFRRFEVPRAAAAKLRTAVLKRTSLSRQTARGWMTDALPGVPGLERCTRAHGVFPPPRRGAALRVSLPTVFRRPRMATRGTGTPQLATGGETRRGSFRPLAAGKMRAAARLMLPDRVLFHSEVRHPRAPGLQPAAGIRHPEAMHLAHTGEVARKTRRLETGWSQREPTANLAVRLATGGILRPQVSEVRAFVLANAPAEGQRTPRIALVTFHSQDLPFGFAEEEQPNR